MPPAFRQLTRNQCGAAAIEYTLIVALVAVALVVGLRTVGSTLANALTTVDMEADGGIQTIEVPGRMAW